MSCDFFVIGELKILYANNGKILEIRYELYRNRKYYSEIDYEYLDSDDENYDTIIQKSHKEQREMYHNKITIFNNGKYVREILEIKYTDLINSLFSYDLDNINILNIEKNIYTIEN